MSDHVRDRLDEVIDRVATSLVSVPDDPDAAERIVSALPVRDRGWWSSWSVSVQAVVLASIVVLIVYARSTLQPSDSSTEIVTGVLDAVPRTTVDALPRGVEPRVARQNLSSDQQSRVTIVAENHAFELQAVAVPGQLDVRTLPTVVPLFAIEPASVAPIALADLPLTIEAPPPFFEE